MSDCMGIVNDGGSEWLWLEFPSAADLSEVRIETYNPGRSRKSLQWRTASKSCSARNQRWGPLAILRFQ
jgi:hypothetical protein